MLTIAGKAKIKALAKSKCFYGADDETRTHDLILTKDVRYHLCHISIVSSQTALLWYHIRRHFASLFLKKIDICDYAQIVAAVLYHEYRFITSMCALQKRTLGSGNNNSAANGVFLKLSALPIDKRESLLYNEFILDLHFKEQSNNETQECAVNRKDHDDRRLTFDNSSGNRE